MGWKGGWIVEFLTLVGLRNWVLSVRPALRGNAVQACEVVGRYALCATQRVCATLPN